MLLLIIRERTAKYKPRERALRGTRYRSVILERAAAINIHRIRGAHIMIILTVAPMGRRGKMGNDGATVVLNLKAEIDLAR